MFKVVKIWNDNAPTEEVYAVGQDADGDPLFLLYNPCSCEWVWKQASLFKPEIPAEVKTQDTLSAYLAERKNNIIEDMLKRIFAEDKTEHTLAEVEMVHTPAEDCTQDTLREFKDFG